MRTKTITGFRGFGALLCSNKPDACPNLTTTLEAREVWMNGFGSQETIAERKREQEALIQELVREASTEIARVRASTHALASLDMSEWERTQRSAHNIAARACALNLGVLASCSRELERFAGAVLTASKPAQPSALQSAAIAIEAVDLELSVLSKSERLV